MSIKPLAWLRSLYKRRPLLGRKKPEDRVFLAIDDLAVGLDRRLAPGVVYEITVVIPRAEIRLKQQDGHRQVEVILNSITISHSPRFPPSTH